VLRAAAFILFLSLFRVPPSRWVVPSNGSITVRLRFMAVQPGEYDDVLNLRIAWTQKTYQLHCRCVAGFPTVTHEPRYVYLFPSCMKTNNQFTPMTPTQLNSTVEGVEWCRHRRCDLDLDLDSSPI